MFVSPRSKAVRQATHLGFSGQVLSASLGGRDNFTKLVHFRYKKSHEPHFPVGKQLEVPVAFESFVSYLSPIIHFLMGKQGERRPVVKVQSIPTTHPFPLS